MVPCLTVALWFPVLGHIGRQTNPAGDSQSLVLVESCAIALTDGQVHRAGRLSVVHQPGNVRHLRSIIVTKKKTGIRSAVFIACACGDEAPGSARTKRGTLCGSRPRTRGHRPDSARLPSAFRPRSTSSAISSRYGSQPLSEDLLAGPDAASPFKKPVVTPMLWPVLSQNDIPSRPTLAARPPQGANLRPPSYAALPLPARIDARSTQEVSASFLVRLALCSRHFPSSRGQ
jgi:hypothetical protein